MYDAFYIIEYIFVQLFVFLPILIIFSLIAILIYFLYAYYKTKREVSTLNKTDMSKFNQFDMDLNFDFNCEYCNRIISTKYDSCPFCHASYYSNNEYLKKKKEKFKKYYNYLKDQENELNLELKNFDNNIVLSERNKFWFVNKTAYNYKIDYDHLKNYIKKDSFDFICEYCGTKLNGNSQDSKCCSNCGASYINNTELLALEEKERVLKANSDLYNNIQLRKLKINQNNAFEDSVRKEQNIKNISMYATIVKYSIILVILILYFSIIMSLLNAFSFG